VKIILVMFVAGKFGKCGTNNEFVKIEVDRRKGGKESQNESILINLGMTCDFQMKYCVVLGAIQGRSQEGPGTPPKNFEPCSRCGSKLFGGGGAQTLLATPLVL